MSFDRIIADPEIMNGQPCIKGTRLTIRRVLRIAALYPDRTERTREFPELTDEDLAQALRYAELSLEDGFVTLPDATAS